jgi:hypothetical protein
MGEVFFVIGAFIVLFSLDVIPYNPNPPVRAFSRRGILDSPHHWQFTCAGLCFFCAGIHMLSKNKYRFIAVPSAFGMTICLAAPLIWLTYFSGLVDIYSGLLMTFCLLAGVGGSIYGQIRLAQEKQPVTDITRDPMAQAAVFASYGRTSQARAILKHALIKQPEERKKSKKP